MKIVGEIPPGYVTALQLQLLQCAVSTQLCYKVQWNSKNTLKKINSSNFFLYIYI